MIYPEVQTLRGFVIEGREWPPGVLPASIEAAGGDWIISQVD